MQEFSAAVHHIGSNEVVFDHRHGGRIKWARDPFALEKMDHFKVTDDRYPHYALTNYTHTQRIEVPTAQRDRLCIIEGTVCTRFLESAITDFRVRSSYHYKCTRGHYGAALAISHPRPYRGVQGSAPRPLLAAALGEYRRLFTVSSRSVAGTQQLS